MVLGLFAHWISVLWRKVRKSQADSLEKPAALIN